MDNIEAIIVRADLTGNLSEASQAAVRDLERLEDAASKAQRSTADIGEGAQRASAGFSALEARLDGNVRLTNAKTAADARLAREIETITRNTEANSAAQARANSLIEAATRNRDAYIARVRQDIAATEQRTARVLGETGALGQFSVANDNASQSSGRMRMALGQAGFQVQDFATQVSMGQNALMAFGVQGAQLAGVFGPTGAIAGAALMIGVIGAQLLLGKNAADLFRESMDRQAASLRLAEEDARRYREGLETEARQVRDLTQYYGGLSEARQSQEMRAYRRDLEDLIRTQDRLRDSALGVAAGLSTQFRQQIYDAQTMAANAYGRGSPEYTAIVTNPDLERMRQFVAVVEGFRETGDVSREALARLYQEMMGLADGSDIVSRRIRQQAGAIDGLIPSAREAETAATNLAARAQVLGVNIDGAGAAADRLRRALDSLRTYDGRIAENIGREISELERQIGAAGQGASALRAEQGNIARENRLRTMVRERGAELERLGVTGEAAAESMATFERETGAILQTHQRLTEQLRRAEEGLRGTGGAARTAAQADEELAAASRAVTAAQRDYDALMREGVGITQSVRTEQEKYAEQLSVLNTLLANGAITQETYNRSVAAADPAMRAAREAARQVEQDNKTTTDSIVRYGADRFADMFGDNKKSWAEMWSSFLSTARATMARIAAEAIIRPVITPIVSSLGLGALGSSNGSGLGSLLGLGGIQGGASGVSTAGSLTAGAQQAQQSAGLFTAGRFGNLGNAFTNAGPAQTGYGWIDGALNTTLWGGANAGINATGAATNAAGYGSMAANAIDAAGSASAAGVGSTAMSAAGAIGGAAGLAGGAYGIYSGVQRGGVGGYTTAAGGLLSAGMGAATLAGLGSLGPAGWAAAAILAVAGAMLPGQKASGKGQSAYVNVDSGSSGFAGLGGDRYSQENRDAAANAANQVAALARQVGEKLGGAQFGSHVAVGVTSGRGNGPGDLYLDVAGRKAQFSNDEAGSKQLAEEAGRLILRQFREANRASGDYAGILNASGDSLETLQKNLDWYEQTYKVLAGTAPKLNEFADGLRGVVAPFDEVIGRAREYGLAVSAIEEKRGKALEEALAPMLGVTTAQTEYERGLENIRENYEATIRVVGELGRGTDDLREAMAKAEVQFKASANAAFQSRVDEVSGNGFLNQIRAAQAEYDANAANAASMGRNYSEITHLAIKNILDGLNAAQLRLVGASDFGMHTGTNDLALAMLPAVEAAERAAAGAEAAAAAQEAAARAQQQAAERLQAVLQAGGGVRAWVDGQRTGAGAGSSPEQRLLAAQDQFGRDLALARDNNAEALARITGTAGSLLSAGGDMYASGPQFQALRTMVLSSLESLPATRSYDQLMLEELKRLGGRIDVAVQVEAVRVITEALNVLPDTERERLVQSQVVLRTVEERLGLLLSPQDLDALVRSELIVRDVQQTLGRDLSAAERAALLADGTAVRTVEQLLGRTLSEVELASLVQGATVQRVLEQTMGRDLSETERAGLVAAASVVRTVEQSLGRTLTAAEVAMVVLPGDVPRTVLQQIAAATGADLLAPGVIDRAIRQSVETTETVQISRSIDDKLSGLLSAINYTMSEHLPYLTRLPDIQTSLFLIKELARGQAGGVRVTTLQSSGGADGGFQQYGSYIGAPFGYQNFGGLEDGGWVGNGVWNKDSVVASFAGGGAIALAGGEHVTNAPMAARYASELNAINAGTFGTNGGNDAMARMLDRLAREIVELRAEMRRVAGASERTAEATEETAASNATMARREVIVGRRAA